MQPTPNVVQTATMIFSFVENPETKYSAVTVVKLHVHYFNYLKKKIMLTYVYLWPYNKLYMYQKCLLFHATKNAVYNNTHDKPLKPITV